MRVKKTYNDSGSILHYQTHEEIMDKKSCIALLALSCIFCGTAFGASKAPVENVQKTTAIETAASEFWGISAGLGYTYYKNASSTNNGGSVIGTAIPELN